MELQIRSMERDVQDLENEISDLNADLDFATSAVEKAIGILSDTDVCKNPLVKKAISVLLEIT